MKINLNLFAGTVVSILIPLMGTATVHAADGKTLPGATCQPKNQSQPFMNTSRGAVFNQSGSTEGFVCPVVRDLMSGDSDGIDDFWMKVYDRNPDQNVSCTFRSMRSNGTTRASSTRQTTGFGSGVKHLEFPALARVTNGYYVVHCMVPRTHSNGSSGILMYKVDEEN